jgi:hypothetical protein
MMLFWNSGAIARYSGNSVDSAKKKNSFASRANSGAIARYLKPWSILYILPNIIELCHSNTIFNFGMFIHLLIWLVKAQTANICGMENYVELTTTPSLTNQSSYEFPVDYRSTMCGGKKSDG